MIQVTDEMVVAAEEGWSLADNNECSPKECWRAALEAALAVREKNSDSLTDDQIAYCHERAELIEALRPFADFAKRVEGVQRGHADCGHYFGGIRYGDLRRVKALLE